MALSSFRTNFQMFNTTVQGVSVVPSLLLDFTKSENLNPRISFSRTTQATRFNSRGLMETVSANTPRFEYDPFTKKLIGLYLEDTKTNLIIESNNFNNEWGNVSTTITRSQNVVGLDGTSSAWTIDDQSSVSGDDGIYQNIAITPSTSTSYCFSIWAKQGTATYFDFYAFFTGNSTKGSFIRHTWSTGVTQALSGDGNGIIPLDYGKIEYPDGWYRFYFVVRDSTNGLNGNLQIRICPAGRSSGLTGTTLFQRAQVEIGEFPSSYMPTTSNTFTRGVEDASITGSLFTPWFNPISGTLFLNAINTTRSIEAKYPRLLSLVGTDPNLDEISLYTRSQSSGDSTAGDAFGSITVTGIPQLDTNRATTDEDLKHKLKLAIAYEKNNSVLATYGRSTNTSTSVNIPPINALKIFGQARYQIKPSGIVQVVAYYPKRLPTEELKVLTLL